MFRLIVSVSLLGCACATLRGFDSAREPEQRSRNLMQSCQEPANGGCQNGSLCRLNMAGWIWCKNCPEGYTGDRCEITPAGKDNDASTSGDALCANGTIGTYAPVMLPDDPYRYAAYSENYTDTSKLCPVRVCCPASCSSCDMGDECSANTPDECCGHKICAAVGKAAPLADTDADISCRNKKAPCVMPPAENDPCAENPCKNGSKCSVEYATIDGECALVPHCDCAAVEGVELYGKFCEQKCEGQGTTACGNGYGLFGDALFKHFDRCCSAEEDCLQESSKFGGVFTRCYPKGRPLQCSDCDKTGTQQCYKSNVFDGDFDRLECVCKLGFEGARCELPTINSP